MYLVVLKRTVCRIFSLAVLATQYSIKARAKPKRRPPKSIVHLSAFRRHHLAGVAAEAVKDTEVEFSPESSLASCVCDAKAARMGEEGPVAAVACP